MAEATQRPRVLFVDDEQNVLYAIARQVRGFVDAELVNFPADAARLLEKPLADGEREFAAIVSDMRMPVMDGATLLKHANEVAPDTTRLLLTGFTDLQTAVAAVNDGNIFRFLTKPCSTPHLRGALEAAIAQHELVRDRRELLDRTLRGAVEALTETLAMAHPAAFARASRLRRLTQEVATALDLPEAWQVEVAAQLAEIGVVTLPPEALDALVRGTSPSPQVLQMLGALPGLADGVLRRIPRLDAIREIVRAQEPVDRPDPARLARANRAAQVLQAVREYDALTARDNEPGVAVQVLRQRAHHPADIVDALQVVTTATAGTTVRQVAVSQLSIGVVLAADLRSSKGMLLVGRGQTLTDPMLTRIRNFASLSGLDGLPLIVGTP